MPSIDFAYSMGERVVVTEAKIEGTVDRVAFGPEYGHEYRIIFWHEGSRRNEWVYEHELSRPGNRR